MKADRPLRKAEQTEATTRRLLDVARALFAERGYSDTSIEDISMAAGVTRGALYHHYRSKEAVFEAVFTELQAEVGSRVNKAARSRPTTWDRLIAGCTEFLRAGVDPSFRRIVLMDAPAVLGINNWRSADDANHAYLLRATLARLKLEGELAAVNVDALSAMLNGALNDAALWIATADNSATAFHEAAEAFKRLAEGARSRGPTKSAVVSPP